MSSPTTHIAIVPYTLHINSVHVLFEIKNVFASVLSMCATLAGEQRLRETKAPLSFLQDVLLHACIALPIEAVWDNTAGSL